MRVGLLIAAVVMLVVASGSVAAAQNVESAQPNRLLAKLGPAVVPRGLGVNIHFAAGHVDDLDMIKTLGFRLVRMDLLWSTVEESRGRYDWRAYDALIRNSQSRGLLPLMILDYSNPLYAKPLTGDASKPHTAYEPPVDEPASSAFAAFVRAAAARYRNQAIWEIWNEPNLSFGEPVRLDRYLQLAAEACQVIRSVDPDASVIGPASAGFDWRFLRDFLEADRANCFDAVSVHPYRDTAPESATEDWTRLWKQVASTDGTSRKVVVNSEWGYSVTGGEWTAERQAAYVARLYLVDLMAGVPVTIVYDLRNDGPSASDMEANFGVLDFHGRPKPVADILRTLTTELDGLSLVGEVRLTAGQYGLVFAAEGKPPKLVAWSSNDRRLPFASGNQLCLQRSPKPWPSCDAADLVLDIEPINTTTGPVPAVMALQVRGCGPRGDTNPLSIWCDSNGGRSK
jgi:hypothetical protein